MMEKKLQQKLDSPQIAIRRIVSYTDYMTYLDAAQDLQASRTHHMAQFRHNKQSFSVSGKCFVCDKVVDFKMDIPTTTVGGAKPALLNWRERLNCPSCGLCNRARAAVHVLQRECLPKRDDVIYMTEQTTRLYLIIKEDYPATIGSELLGGEVPFGQTNAKGVRNESVTGLTFPDNSLDFILSVDVLEHVPAYRKGFAECLRCLKPGGMMLFSVPFIPKNEATLVRATVGANGSVTHLLPPEYHGDPINSAGCLCFYHFGWDILSSLRAAGFGKAEALLYWSSDFGYLGNADQIIFLARKNSG
jgi:SAM-dependent methyltransferase